MARQRKAIFFSKCTVATALSIFSFRNNQLKSLPDQLSQCGQLRDLVISFNRFPEIPPVVYRLRKLEHIIADDNQVSHMLHTTHTLTLSHTLTLTHAPPPHVHHTHSLTHTHTLTHAPPPHVHHPH